MQTLPLSWSLEDNQTQKNISSSLLNSKLTWLSVCSFQNHSQFVSYINHFSSKQKDNLIIRGCNNHLSNYLKSKGYSTTKVGMEAVLETTGEHFEKKSIKELVRRGLRHGKVVQVPFSITNKNLLEDFKLKTTHANEPQLQNLFQTEFSSDNLLYVFISNKTNLSNKWLGAVLVSQNGRQKLHTELILRTKDSPVGIIEAIIHKVFYDAKNKQFRELSLGEVPFITNHKNYKRTFTEYFAMSFGRMLKFAYSYDGLYKFKNKFNPRWDNLYICSKPKVGFEHLIFLFVKSNFLKLVLYKVGIIVTKQNFIKKTQKNLKLLRPLLDFN